VVKVGTNVLAAPGMPLDEARVDSLSEQVARLAGAGRQVALVSSGAIGSGMAELGMSERPSTLPALQAAASVGQGRLVARYQAGLRAGGLHAGQVLLTREDFESRERYLNASNTIRALLDLGCIPVINENDTISTAEIRFGDNDLLAALVTHLIRAELLILLTSVPGLYARAPLPKAVRAVHEPGVPAAGDLVLADVVARVDEAVLGLATEEKTPLGIGGMRSKLEAARIATEAGEAAVIADGRAPDILRRVTDGERVGTLFLPARKKVRSYKRWIRYNSRPRGALSVDEGARRALCRRGGSLLPSGVRAVEGKFGPGDVVRIKGPDGVEFARGLSNYSSEHVELIKGLKTDRIEAVLGHRGYDEIVHRDHLALIE